MAGWPSSISSRGHSGPRSLFSWGAPHTVSQSHAPTGRCWDHKWSGRPVLWEAACCLCRVPPIRPISLRSSFSFSIFLLGPENARQKAFLGVGFDSYGLVQTDYYSGLLQQHDQLPVALRENQRLCDLVEPVQTHGSPDEVVSGVPHLVFHS